MDKVPDIRVNLCNDARVNARGDFVLYWMIANRRTRDNFSLQRAVEWSVALNKPLVILEALRCGYGWASDRLHAFIIQGMRANATALEGHDVLYYPYLEPKPDEGKGFLAALGARACVVVTDDFPEFFLPRMLKAAARQLSVRLEQVDSNGLLPMRQASQVFPSAYSFRRFLQRALAAHLPALPEPDPLAELNGPRLSALPEEITRRWPRAPIGLTGDSPSSLSSFPIDHRVNPSNIPGGAIAAQATLERFLREGLPQYAEARNQPEDEVTSGLSPYLHFGHISAHRIFRALMEREGWSAGRLGHRATGSRSGWWGVSEPAEAFLDQLITWRELGFNMCWQTEDYDRYESLPEWARRTLGSHANDPRDTVYTLEDFEAGRTHDPLWNAAQMQLVREGRLHNYLRMLWGKKILEWSRTPQDALRVMIELNNQYGLDGRGPNSYSGIFWVLGRYDRPWGPERPIFGKIRYMSSESTARKLRVRNYIQRYVP